MLGLTMLRVVGKQFCVRLDGPLTVLFSKVIDQKRWRLYILPQYLTNLTQPVGIEKAIYSCDIHPCTVTLCIDGDCTFYYNTSQT